MPAEVHPDRFVAERQKMVDWQVRDRGIRDLRVLDAMTRVPRHEFVAEQYWDQAYEDHPIPIGQGQTVSQPYIVALTLDALDLQPFDVVLEVGTGSGYQTALLAILTDQVYSMERHEALARHAEATLARLGYHNVNVIVGDGSEGLPTFAPFEAIAVSAAAPQIPSSLFEQLREGGRMVIPVGPADVQELQLVRKREGHPVVETLEACRFVPLIGGQGYRSDW
ncbi:MAG TPA: protein-L-isoaspartate(D-aspartate) O-methyltransferase [Terriglobales bacterium]|nr:protein-L-isoaspartate(D-aspartate) O-methyltransferase [Terriglobales bacterium]